MDIAPVVLFVYNRPWHTRQTIEALKKNNLSDKTDLIIFSDAAKDREVASKVQQVREYLKTVNGFNSVRIVERENNWGLAQSIIQGVTDVVNQYGKVIVLEDDIVTSPAFLKFMNQALNYYEKKNKVWHISGWNYPIDTNGLGDAFLWRFMNCWGWATWADRWAFFDKNPDRLIESWSKEKRWHFDLDGSGIAWYQVIANSRSEIDTWAIFWYSSIYEQGGLCLNPTLSYVDNIGLDGSGVHNENSETHRNNRGLSEKVTIVWPEEIEESQMAVEVVKNYYKKTKKSIKHLIGVYLNKFFLKK